MQPIVHIIEKNREIWRVATSVFQKYSEGGMTGMDILLNTHLEEEVLLKFNDFDGMAPMTSNLSTDYEMESIGSSV